ncbi:alpha/beta hydrolase [Sphingomonas sp. BT-65]|uniref:alpha/beta hydrolase n=1 Tax=Sphingomonas sp. BT-65 TaxID=2989821 RepID=UPI00223602A9|nr:alpha/beta hydrolase [Sphingomonas sp. BT-65]MCW4460126.1 alpha/beta hydrolase [Sphingomonas sp. BT-65]
MTLALAPASHRFSVITISESQTPAWSERFGWPAFGDTHLALDPNGNRSILAAQLDNAVLRADRAVLLVAEGLGCFAASWWARLSPSHYVDRVAGALLFDPETAEAAAGKRDLFASPRTALPFPSMVVADRLPGSDPADFAPFAQSWGSRLIAGNRHRAGEASAWRSAQRLVERLTASVVARDIERGLALRGEG